ncbi:MAG: hypothetical protein J2O48_07370 [Solirubrobacterales bacterium]|nr:hypothetical protein [Solirubrobacterales bacterium]
MPAWLPAFNRPVTNPLQGLWAPYVKPYAVVIHTGRNSGRQYRTPVVASVWDQKIAIGLPYSARAQWVRNLEAAGGGEVLRTGKRYRLSAPRVVTEPGSEPLSPTAERLLKRMPVLVADLAG